MPELAQLTPAHLLGTPSWEPQAGTAINPEALYAVAPKPVINNASAVKAGLVSSIAQAVGDLPGKLQDSYWQGYNQAKARAQSNDPNASVTYNSDGTLTVRKPTALEQQIGAANLGILSTEGAQKAIGLKMTQGLMGDTTPAPVVAAPTISGAPYVDPNQTWRQNAGGLHGATSAAPLPANPSPGGLTLSPDAGTGNPLPAPPAAGLSGAAPSDFDTATTQQDAAGGLSGIPAPAGLAGATQAPQKWIPKPEPTPLVQQIPMGKIIRNPENGTETMITATPNGPESKTGPINPMFQGARFKDQFRDDGSPISANTAAEEYARSKGIVWGKKTINSDGSITMSAPTDMLKLSPAQQKQAADLDIDVTGIQNVNEYNAAVGKAREELNLSTPDQVTHYGEWKAGVEKNDTLKNALLAQNGQNAMSTILNSVNGDASKLGPAEAKTMLETLNQTANHAKSMGPRMMKMYEQGQPLGDSLAQSVKNLESVVAPSNGAKQNVVSVPTLQNVIKTVGLMKQAHAGEIADTVQSVYDDADAMNVKPKSRDKYIDNLKKRIGVTGDAQAASVPVGNTVNFISSSGKSFTIPAEKLNDAKARDPGLTVLQ